MNHRQFKKSTPGIGATDELSLRVSVAGMVRVLFEDSRNGDLMLALERRATLHKMSTREVVEVKSQPFGGALRLYDIEALHSLIGDFHFDSEESQAEQDFRIFIRPATWEAVRRFCLEYLSQPNNPVLESDPTRELEEEFLETLKIGLRAEQYTLREVATIVEDNLVVTTYFHTGYPTARIYRIFEARILDGSLASAMLRNSEKCSDENLRDIAWHDSRNGGHGRANAVLTLPLRQIHAAYLGIRFESRNTPIWFQNHQLDETVAAVLDDVSVPKYRRVS